MSAELVDRLRAEVTDVWGYRLGALLNEAADRIDTLEARLDTWKQRVWTGARLRFEAVLEIKQLRAHIESLEARLADQQAVIDAAVAWKAAYPDSLSMAFRFAEHSLADAVARLTDRGEG